MPHWRRRGTSHRPHFASGRCAWLIPCTLVAACTGCQSPISPRVGTPFDPAAPARYTLQPGDTILVRYPSDSTLDQEVIIRTDGQISLPYVNDVQAALRSPSELAVELNERYETILKKPDVTVIVKEESGRRVYIGGEVQTPGEFELRPNQTLLQAIIAAGGLRTEAERREVMVLRACAGAGIHVLQVDVDRILAGAEPDVRLEPLDIVHAPRSTIAQVGDFVDQYINRMVPRMFSATFLYELHNEPIKTSGNSATFPVEVIRRR